ncbi:MAG TPA: hypothetical protein VFC65_14830 [Prolixibacteraceae bacterium]|nr:hypothetical protein [Prolixibacteraceae bacterium]
MRAIEFKSKIRNNQIQIPKKVQSELRTVNETNVRVMILLDDSANQDLRTFEVEEKSVDLANDELESINKGLTDFDEGKIHSHETARKIYGKYL